MIPANRSPLAPTIDGRHLSIAGLDLSMPRSRSLTVLFEAIDHISVSTMGIQYLGHTDLLLCRGDVFLLV